MKTDKQILKFILRTKLFVIIFFGSIMIFNYIVDPYGVLRSHQNRHRATGINNHFVKIRHILRNKDKYDSFVMGASTAAKIDVRKIKNGRYYSISYSLSVPYESLQDIKLMLKKGVKIKNIIMGLEDLSYKEDPLLHFKQYRRFPYTENIKKNTAYIFKNLFLIHDINYYIKTIVNKKYRKNGFEYSTVYDIENTGLVFAPGLDEYIEKDSADYVKSEIFNKPRRLNRPQRIDKTIEEIKQICELANSENIHLVFYMSPIHHTTYMNINQKEFFLFKKKLADVTDYYDFSGLNSITTNNFYFYETSHFRFCVGDWIINKLFGSGFAPEDFGELVNKNNIAKHLAVQKEQLLNAGYVFE